MSIQIYLIFSRKSHLLYGIKQKKKTTIDLPSWQILLKTWRISNALRTTGSGWNAFGVSRTTPSKLLTLCRTKFCYDRGKIIIRQLVSVHSSSPKLNQMESTWLDSEWVFFRLLVTWIERFSENHLWFSPRALFFHKYVYIYTNVTSAVFPGHRVQFTHIEIVRKSGWGLCLVTVLEESDSTEVYITFYLRNLQPRHVLSLMKTRRQSWHIPFPNSHFRGPFSIV